MQPNKDSQNKNKIKINYTNIIKDTHYKSMVYEVSGQIPFTLYEIWEFKLVTKGPRRPINCQGNREGLCTYHRSFLFHIMSYIATTCTISVMPNGTQNFLWRSKLRSNMKTPYEITELDNNQIMHKGERSHHSETWDVGVIGIAPLGIFLSKLKPSTTSVSSLGLQAANTYSRF